MIEDMTVRHFKEKVRKDYIRHVTNFKDFLGRSPDTATSEDLCIFQLHMTRSHVAAPSTNCAIVELRFFFTVTLERPDLVRHLTFVHEPRKLLLMSVLLHDPIAEARNGVRPILRTNTGVVSSAASVSPHYAAL